MGDLLWTNMTELLHVRFSPENHARLKKYLGYCWTIIVRCFTAYKVADVRVLISDELSLVLHELNHRSLPYGHHYV